MESVLREMIFMYCALWVGWHEAEIFSIYAKKIRLDSENPTEINSA